MFFRNKYYRITHIKGGFFMADMSQEEIDKLLRESQNNNNEIPQVKEDTDTMISQQEIDKILQEKHEEEPTSSAQGMSQSEIDALLNAASSNSEKSQIDMIQEEKNRMDKEDLLTQTEIDAIGELGNISFGSASTTLSTILNKTVQITTPQVEVIKKGEVEDWELPHVVLNVNYVKGLEMENLLVIQKDVALIISDLMMGGQGIVDNNKELTELELSAVQESMNQMMGTSATSMSEIFNTIVDISPPSIKLVDGQKEEDLYGMDEDVVRISFNLTVEDIIQSKLVQVVSVENAKKIAQALIQTSIPVVEEVTVLMDNQKQVGKVNEVQTSLKNETNSEKLKPLLRDIIVNIEVIFGHTTKTLKEILEMEPGYIQSLEQNIDDYLEMYANGILIAYGKIVNVEGSFGIEIKELVV